MGSEKHKILGKRTDVTQINVPGEDAFDVHQEKIGEKSTNFQGINLVCYYIPHLVGKNQEKNYIRKMTNTKRKVPRIKHTAHVSVVTRVGQRKIVTRKKKTNKNKSRNDLFSSAKSSPTCFLSAPRIFILRQKTKKRENFAHK